MHRDPCRIEAQRRPVGLDGFIGGADVAQRVAEVLENVGARAAALQEASIALDRFAGTLQVLQRGAEIARCRGGLRVELERLAKAGLCGLMLAALAVQVAQVIVGVGAPRVQRDELLVGRDGLLPETEPVIRRGEEIPGVGVAAVRAQQLLEQDLGRAVLAPPEQVLRFSERGRAAPADPG